MDETADEHGAVPGLSTPSSCKAKRPTHAYAQHACQPIGVTCSLSPVRE